MGGYPYYQTGYMWAEAQTYSNYKFQGCQGYLATITSFEENDWIQSMYGGTQYWVVRYIQYRQSIFSSQFLVCSLPLSPLGCQIS